MKRSLFLSSAIAAAILPISAAHADDAAASAADRTITVTATRVPTLTSEVPATVTVIDAEQIADELATDVHDLVRFEPGVSVRRAPARFGAALGTTGRDGNSGFTVRGIGGNRVLIQVDGIRAPDGFTFGAQSAGRGDYADLGLVKSVEILRGPASALYGSDGLSGAVSFVTTDPEDMLAVTGNDLTGMLRGTYDSSSNEFSETAILAGRSGPWSALAAFTRRDGEELDNEGDVGGTGQTRTLPNPQDTRSNNFLGKIVFAPDANNRIRLTGEWLDTFIYSDVLSARATSAFTGATTDSLTARDTIERVRLSLDWRYQNEGGAIDYAQIALYWQDSDNRQTAFEERTPQDDRSRINSFDNRVWGASAEARSSFETGAFSHSIVFGGDISFTNQTGVRDGTVPPTGETFPTAAFPETDYMQGGLYVGDQIEFGPITLFPALRFDFYDLDPKADPLLPTFTGAGQSNSRLTPRIGVIGEIGGGVSLYGNYAQGFRAPEPGQMNQFFENLIFGYTSAPNPDLRPETSETFEGGIRFDDDIVSASLTAFFGRYDDFIAQVQVSGSFTPADPGVFQFVNLDEVEIEGVEGRVGLDFPSGFNFDAAFAYATGDVISQGARFPLETVDPLEVVLGAGWRDPDGRFGGRVIMTSVARESLEDSLGTACAPQCFRPGSFTTFDATAFYRFNENFTVRAGLFNITDEKYAYWRDVRGLSETAVDLDAYTQPGRNFRVSLTARF
ncbi:TonB-dependent hemoglobin/transferrin/lactoferrin family receptor [Parasphingopyxis marina]|uniref:TonB-dependent hemoglobin/transferrin/lactoferrin family receptor n=1 Tax=Parasphingopyxis marina TaxID=2761622 RepID=A0A842HVZ2_9SPHN|nr:TonB-dependent hemoglobin/transferrin/lactoferrin family receptor [Parasphingopyxis marina]MBC2776531.1 TonB-dependent hemoglobin/transferrin/lactoferrin family receptor [Parasphingopyxis marina]